MRVVNEDGTQRGRWVGGKRTCVALRREKRRAIDNRAPLSLGSSTTEPSPALFCSGNGTENARPPVRLQASLRSCSTVGVHTAYTRNGAKPNERTNPV